MSTSRNSELRAVGTIWCFFSALAFALVLAPSASGAASSGQRAYAILQQQRNKLVGTGASAGSQQGNSVAISADGNTAIVGGPQDSGGNGAAWIFVRTNGAWSQQGTKLVGTGAVGNAQQGWSVAISGDGNTALVGGPADDSGIGATWVFTRSGGAWSQQTELVAITTGIPAAQGWSVTLSADGNTAAIGGYNMNGASGAVWIFTRTAGVWSVQTALLVSGLGEIGAGQFGYSVALSADGNKLIAGGNTDNSGVGGAWLFKRTGATWNFAGHFIGAGATGAANQGSAVAISGDGSVFALGGPLDTTGTGAIWIFTFQVDHFGAAGGKITGASSDGVGASAFGDSLAFSRDGSVLVVGGLDDNSNQGAVWQFGRTNLTTWTQQGAKLVPSDESAGSQFGVGVALSADGNTGFFGGILDSAATGAGWAYDNDVYLGNSNVGDIGTKTVSLQMQNAFTVGSISVVTQGAANLDFTAAASQPASGACQTGEVFAPGTNICSINIKFAPTASGMRPGAIRFYDGSNVLQATIYLHGIGLAPLVGLSNAVINAAAGNGTLGSSGDGGPATSAQLLFPHGVAVDGVGNLVISDTANQKERYVNLGPSAVTALGVAVQPGDIQTIAGNGTSGSLGDGGPATSAEFSGQQAPFVDGAGILYVSDQGNNKIRSADPATGIINTFAGGGGFVNTDGVLAANSTLLGPTDVFSDSNGNIFIADQSHNKVRRVAAETGIITTVAGTGSLGFSGEGGPATSAQLNSPSAVAIDSNGNLFISDQGNAVIREVTFGTGTITIITGTAGSSGFTGDGGPATSAQLGSSVGIALDPAGNLYVADTSNNAVREVFASTGIINTIAGDNTGGRGSSGNGGLATSALMFFPNFPAYDGFGNLYISDQQNNMIRKVNGAAPLAFAPTAAGLTSAAQDVTVTNNGNAPLVLSSQAASANYDLGGADTTCSTSSPVNPGESCVLGIEFSPNVAGSIPGSVTLVDNAGTQIVTLSGIGLLTSTTTTATASPNPAGQGQPITLTATVAPPPLGSPLGTVAFSNGATSLGSGNVNSSGVATLVTLTLPVGVDSITGIYSGNAGFATSTSPAVSVTVTPVTATTTTLTVSPNPAAIAGQIVTFTATVTPAPTGTSLGTVNFYSGTTLLGTANMVSSGIVTFTSTGLATGSDSLTATYSGNAGFAASTSSATTETVNPLTATTTTLTVSPNPVASGQTATFTATVSPTPTGTSLGTVTFFSGTTQLGTANLNSSGIATFTSTTLATGSLSLTATYSGNATSATSNSTAFSETVNAAYTVIAPPAPVPVPEGGNVNVGLTVPPLGGAYNSPVTMSAAGLPAGATAIFNPPTVTPGALCATTMMTVQLPKPIASVPPSRKRPFPSVPVSFVLALCGGLYWYRRAKQLRLAFATILLAGATMALLGCNGGLGGPTVAAGNYVITVTGTSGSLHSSTTVTLVVQ
jgi:hypothetical protein